MLRSRLWAVAISASLAALYSVQSVRAAVSAQGGGTKLRRRRRFGSGAGMRAVTPGVAGSRLGTSGVAAPELASPGTAGSRFATPQGPATIRPGIVTGTRGVYARHGVPHPSGANYPRYHYRHRGYPYHYGGWWYAYPWWIDNGSNYGGER